MAPFPETEIMTIKRLEVALRKMDFKLLKDGAYKLHEKYHSGHRFEYLDLLKEIFLDVSNNPSVPEDVRDILAPTIEDILESSGASVDNATSPYESLNQNRVSSLTSLSYAANNEIKEVKEEPKSETLSAFDAFTSPSIRRVQNETISTRPFREFSAPHLQQNEPKTEERFEQAPAAALQTQVLEEQQAAPLEDKVELKSAAIFYGQQSTQEKINGIIRYRELISKPNTENIPLGEILELISRIRTQANTGASELQGIFEGLRNRENRINFITSSQSADISELFQVLEIPYSLFNVEEDKNINILPLFGLSNLFKCSKCEMEYLEKNEEMSSFILECPRCKSPMFPDLYSSLNQNCGLNMNCYNSSMIALANSKIWLLMHPSLDEKVTVDLLRSALKISSQVENIFIIDKDINTKDTYRKLLSDINPSVEINTQMSAMDDFFNAI